MPPEFIYFDMGNVLLNFSHEREAEQVARVAGLRAADVWRLLFENGAHGEALHWQAERGELDPRQFYDRFCAATGSRPPYVDFEAAGNDIFWPNELVLPIVTDLRAAGFRLGVLSNTSESHWRHCTARFPFLRQSFEAYALSFEIGVMKPGGGIYARATALAGVPPANILFIDDRPDNVEAARACGWRAAQFTTPENLARDLAANGVSL